LEANVNNQNQRDKGTGRFVPRKKGDMRNPKCQANQMQGQKKACVSGNTWNQLEQADKETWDKLSDCAKQVIATKIGQALTTD